MNNEKITQAVREAKRFLDRHKAFAESLQQTPHGYAVFGSKESGALRRASMDLTRALAEMRKP
jgi:hypothetical protein